MKNRRRTRAALVALGVAASSLTFSAIGATEAQACGTHMLGPSHTIWGGSRSIGTYYLGWNDCDKTVYTEAHIWNTNWTHSSGQIVVHNSGSWSLGPSKPVVVFDGTAWWTTTPLSIYSNPSSDRRYKGSVQINNSNGTARCVGYTPTWDFSGAGVVDPGSGDMHC